MTLEKLKEYADEKNITIIDGALKNKKRRPNLLELKEKKAPQKGDFIFSYKNTYLSEKIIRTYIQKNDRNLFKKCGIFVGVLSMFFGANDDIFSLTIHR